MPIVQAISKEDIFALFLGYVIQHLQCKNNNYQEAQPSDRYEKKAVEIFKQYPQIILQVLEQRNESCYYYHDHYTQSLLYSSCGNLLHILICHDFSAESINELLKNDILKKQIDEEDLQYASPLHIAVISNKFKVAQCLIDNGADTNIMMLNEEEMYLVFYASRYIKHPDFPNFLISLLIKATNLDTMTYGGQNWFKFIYNCNIFNDIYKIISKFIIENIIIENPINPDIEKLLKIQKKFEENQNSYFLEEIFPLNNTEDIVIAEKIIAPDILHIQQEIWQEVSSISLQSAELKKYGKLFLNYLTDNNIEAIRICEDNIVRILQKYSNIFQKHSFNIQQTRLIKKTTGNWLHWTMYIKLSYGKINILLQNPMLKKIIDERTKNGLPAIAIAVTTRNIEMIHCLIQNDADVNTTIKTDKHEIPLLHYAAMFSMLDHVSVSIKIRQEIVKILLGAPNIKLDTLYRGKSFLEVSRQFISQKIIYNTQELTIEAVKQFMQENPKHFNTQKLTKTFEQLAHKRSRGELSKEIPMIIPKSRKRSFSSSKLTTETVSSIPYKNVIHEI